MRVVPIVMEMALRMKKTIAQRSLVLELDGCPLLTEEELIELNTLGENSSLH